MNPLSRYPAAFYMLLAVASCATTSQGSDELEIADEALWGGAEVKSSQLSAGLLIRHSCSAARVGSRHILTAAHCVWDKSTGKAKAGHEPGDVLSISSALDPSERGWSSVTVASVHLDPAFVPALADHVAGVRMLHAAGAADIALIVTTQDLPRWIGRAYVDTRPLEARTRVTIVGYGCDDWNYGANYDYDFAYKQYARTRIGELSDILREADPPEDPGIDNADFRRTYAVSPGPYVKDDAPALCWGDSGGPLYRAGTKGIVGVNALALGVIPNDQFGIYLNGFTRTDARSGSGVAEWLRRAGADVR